VIDHLRLFSSFALTASLIAVVTASCGLDTSGTSALGDDDDGAVPLDANGLFDTSTSNDAQGSLDATHLGDSGTTDGAHPNDASPLDATQDVTQPIDATPVDATPVDATPLDSSPVCTTANGCYTIPSGGWVLVASETSQADACPTGFATHGPTDAIEQPNVGANACGCATCSVTTQPSCTGVPVSIDYDGFGCPQTPACGCTGNPSQNANTHAGTCNTDLYTGPVTGLDLKFTPGAPAAGACTAASTENPQNVTYGGHDRLCVQDSATSGNCVGNQCTPDLAAPYKACIALPGHQSCAAPFTVLHDLGSGADYTCGACGCTTSTTSKCDGTMTYYTDNTCSSGAKTFDADGTSCASAGTGMYGGYIFTGVLGAGTTSCSATAGAPANVTLANELTVCCVP
jgi:hypothetical protein